MVAGGAVAVSLALKFRDRLKTVSQYLVWELDQLLAVWRAAWGAQHTDAGGHTDVTATSLSVTSVVLANGVVTFTEITAPSNGATNTAQLFCRDNGAGKTQLCVIFGSGAVQVVATEP